MSASRVAIVGAGPAGLFTAAELLAQDADLTVDIFDRLPTPFGLLRYGVAPDHASIKAVATTLARVFDDPRARFLGMVELGRDVHSSALRASYDAVVYAMGAEDDRRMQIPGEELPGSHSARQFVSWYSGHPDATPLDLTGVRNVAVIGVGNVACDVARILLKDRNDLSTTDMPDSVLAALRSAEIENVWLVGRRGPENATFSSQELRELVSIPGVDVHREGPPWVTPDPETLDRRAAGNLAAMTAAIERPHTDAQRHLHLAFWQRPVRLIGTDKVTGLEVERTGAEREAEGPALTVLPVDLVLRSIGYLGVPVPGVPFDNGRIPHLEGRVVDDDLSERPGEYAVGWIKRGPVGLIGSNRKDARETAASVLADLPSLPRRDLTDLVAQMADAGIHPSGIADWRRIDQAEIARGGIRGRERTKIEAWHDLLDLVSAAEA